MKSRFLYPGIFLSVGAISLLILQSCSMSDTDVETLKAQVTSLAGTVSALQTGMAPTSTPLATPTALPTNTPMPTIISTPQKPTVTEDTLCWLGPGIHYEVVSSIKKDTEVELLGVGNISGWLIVLNPRYHDPCWIMQSVMQIDPNTDLSSLTVYSAPPLYWRRPPPPEEPPFPPFPPHP
jgi:hypothetical protein